eukprot:3034101-Amphidinium_carterae.2
MVQACRCPHGNTWVSLAFNCVSFVRSFGLALDNNELLFFHMPLRHDLTFSARGNTVQYRDPLQLMPHFCFCLGSVACLAYIVAIMVKSRKCVEKTARKSSSSEYETDSYYSYSSSNSINSGPSEAAQPRHVASADADEVIFEGDQADQPERSEPATVLGSEPSQVIAGEDADTPAIVPVAEGAQPLPLPLDAPLHEEVPPLDSAAAALLGARELPVIASSS